jgi:TRAP-type mannitol/chloroaromatic compound transport system permease large subunit
MLSLIVVAIMLASPRPFTLMGIGIIFALPPYTIAGSNPLRQKLDSLRAARLCGDDQRRADLDSALRVHGIPVERANLIEKLFRSLHLALARVPGSLAVATLILAPVFATATGIVGAVVTLMGLLAFPGNAARRLQREDVRGA